VPPQLAVASLPRDTYLPAPQQHKLGGCETWRAKSSYLEVDASPKIVAQALLVAP
jgi:hypothetical protein